MTIPVLVVLGLLGIIMLTRKFIITVNEIPTGSSRTDDIARAIAKAEGFYVSDSLPQRSNNPGSLKLHGDSLTVFDTPEEGWKALDKQIRLILDGRSKFYTPDMTIEEIALVWTGNDKPDAWASIVSGELGVSKQTQFISV